MMCVLMGNGMAITLVQMPIKDCPFLPMMRFMVCPHLVFGASLKPLIING
ncbi:hypothetical protein [Moraxella lacunata]